MKKKRLLKLVVPISLILALAVAACAPAPAPEEPIKIGAILALTGFGAAFEIRTKEGIVLRLEEANYQVAGRPIEIIFEDNASDEATSVEKAKKLVELDKVDLILGPGYSNWMWAVV